MSRLKLAVALGLLLGAACAPEPPPEPGLNADERLLIDAYVRLSLLEALRVDSPDSVNSILDSLSAAWDSTQIVDRIEIYQSQPFRWEKIYGAITAELNRLEKNPDNYWQEIRRQELHAPLENAVADSSASTPESDR